MIAQNLISDYIKPINTEENGEQALVKMHEYNANQLPVVENSGKYVGLISMEEIINMKHLSVPLKELIDVIHKPFVIDTAHMFDVMRVALDANVRIVPVVDEDHRYLGVISAESCLRAFAVMNSVKEPGGILELEKHMNEYSLSEIGRIVEENNANIYCLYSNINQATQQMEITIKVNITNLTSLIATFERFNYVVKGVYNETEYTEDMMDRYASFMRFLNV